MDQDNQPQQMPVSEPMAPAQAPMPSTEERNLGPAIGVIVIIALIVLGGLYFWGQRIDRKSPAPMETGATQDMPAAREETPGADLTTLETQGTGDDITSISADIEATNLSELGTEVNAMNQEAASQ
jgi:hypothetical protein